MTNRETQITVFIPVYNGELYIGRAIESVLTQTYKDFRLIIVDNCSTDNTRDLVRKYLSDERVVLLKRPYNVGMIGNFNGCLEDIQTKYYMILSHDDYLCSDKALAMGVDILEKHEDVQAVYSETMFVDTHDQPIAKRSFGLSGVVDNDAVAKKAIVTGRNIFGVPVLIRADAINDARYSDRFPHTADIDFSVAIGRNKKVFFIPTMLVAIRFHKKNSTHRSFGSLKKEFIGIAEKYHMALSVFDVISMTINDYMVRLKKQLFFYYLDYIRR